MKYLTTVLQILNETFLLSKIAFQYNFLFPYCSLISWLCKIFHVLMDALLKAEHQADIQKQFVHRAKIRLRYTGLVLQPISALMLSQCCQTTL